MFVHLIQQNGEVIIVNSDLIVCMRPSSTRGTFIETAGTMIDGRPRTIDVREALERVLALLQVQ